MRAPILRHLVPTSLALAAATLAACAAPARAPAPPIGNTAPPEVASASALPTITGRYRTRHTIQMVCGPDGWCDEEVDDTMVVRDAGDGRLAIVVELVRTNAHTCSFEGTLAPVADAPAGEPRWRYHDPSSDDAPCDLTLTLRGDELRLAAEGCRYYCGARASLDATFSRTAAP